MGRARRGRAVTTSRGPFEEDVYFVLTYDDGSNSAIPLGEAAACCHGCRSCPVSTTRRSSARWQSVRKAYRRCGAGSSIAPRAANQCPILGRLGADLANLQRLSVLDNGLT